MTTIIEVPKKEASPKLKKTRDWIHRIALGLAVFLPLFIIGAALGTKFGLWSWQSGLGATRNIGMKLIFGTLGMGVLSALAAFFVKPRKGWWVAVLAIILPLAFMVKGASVKKTAQSLPFIHDVSTDTQNPPTFSGVIKTERAAVKGVNTLDYIGKRDKPAGKGGELVSVLQVKAYPTLRPLVVGAEPDVAFGQALATVKSMGWKVAYSNPETGQIDATATTFWYGFKDDVTVRIQPSEGGGSLVDVRSISRVGGSDLGANAARVEAFLSKMNP